MFTSTTTFFRRCRWGALALLTVISLYAVPVVMAGPGCSPTATGC